MQTGKKFSAKTEMNLSNDLFANESFQLFFFQKNFAEKI
jgi:hypothetical protein